jgi:hypothetical protein
MADLMSKIGSAGRLGLVGWAGAILLEPAKVLAALLAVVLLLVLGVDGSLAAGASSSRPFTWCTGTATFEGVAVLLMLLLVVVEELVVELELVVGVVVEELVVAAGVVDACGVVEAVGGCAFFFFDALRADWVAAVAAEAEAEVAAVAVGDGAGELDVAEIVEA